MSSSTYVSFSLGVTPGGSPADYCPKNSGKRVSAINVYEDPHSSPARSLTPRTSFLIHFRLVEFSKRARNVLSYYWGNFNARCPRHWQGSRKAIARKSEQERHARICPAWPMNTTYTCL